jgi:hypothetical protein
VGIDKMLCLSAKIFLFIVHRQWMVERRQLITADENLQALIACLWITGNNTA